MIKLRDSTLFRRLTDQPPPIRIDRSMVHYGKSRARFNASVKMDETIVEDPLFRGANKVCQNSAR